MTVIREESHTTLMQPQKVVQCNNCAFTYGAEHTVGSECAYFCPACAQDRLQAENTRLYAENTRLQEGVKRCPDCDGDGVIVHNPGNCSPPLVERTEQCVCCKGRGWLRVA